MQRRDFLKNTSKAILAGILAAPPLFVNCGVTRRKPNFVFILIDDLGWTDLSCFGSEVYETPNIDQLAAKSMKFTNAYAACTVCSPTRASILTGKYPATLNLTDWIPGHALPHAKLQVPQFNQELPLNEITLAEVLSEAGYVSTSIGKWHLGHESFYPEEQGFDSNIGGTHKGQPPIYFAPYNIPTLEEGPEGEYLTDRLADEAIQFIETNQERPFFLYWPHFAVHTPLQAKPELVDKYQQKMKPEQAQNNPTYAAMIESVDQAVGRIVEKLQQLNLSENTIIIFMSDNGGLARVTSNEPLRAGKGSAYEGGHRTPMFIYWPQVIQPGAVGEVPVSSIDFYPTILEMAGVNVPNSEQIDGLSLVPLLTQTGELNREALFWHYPHYHPGGATPYSAVRQGDFKLIEYFEDNRVELYNLKSDLSETQNLAQEMPEKRDELLKLLADWRQQVKAQMPTPNPNFDPAREREWSWLRRQNR